jgi:hypothetical protein
MSNKIINKLATTTAFLALLLAVAVGVVDAQAEHPIGDGDDIAHVDLGGVVWIAPVDQLAELEAATGETATVEALGSVVSALAPATPRNGVRFDGCSPDVGVNHALNMLGYTAISLAPPALASSTMATLRTN